MRTGKCPKCSSTEVYSAVGRGDDATTGISAGEGVLLVVVYRSKGLLGEKSIGYVNSLICSGCGYIEFYAADMKLLGKIGEAANWRKVET